MNEIKLHLGCFSRRIPGWIHIDRADFKHINYNQGIDDLHQFSANTVSEIYCSHALEYFDRQEAIEVLYEWFRVLKKDGLLRIAVPDFENIVKVYQKYGDIEHKGILGPLYGRMEIPVKKIYIDNDGSFITNANITKLPNLIYHKTIYDFKSLKKLLESVGFEDVQRYDVVEFFKTLPDGYDDQSFGFIPHMDPKGICVSLNVTCRK